MVANAADPSMCMVATEDRAERETVAAAGAAVLRAEDLRVWVERAEARQVAAMKVLREKNDRTWRGR